MDVYPYLEEGNASLIASLSKDFECHVTLAPEYGTELVTKIAERLMFKTSFLVGDDMLGSAKHFYCTSHDYTFARMKGRMDELIKYLADNGVPIKRKKIEHILLDERFEHATNKANYYGS